MEYTIHLSTTRWLCSIASTDWIIIHQQGPLPLQVYVETRTVDELHRVVSLRGRWTSQRHVQFLEKMRMRCDNPATTQVALVAFWPGDSVETVYWHMNTGRQTYIWPLHFRVYPKGSWSTSRRYFA
ncbi:hypothetical protein [Sulfobacillus thermosulfidooxidans]|nr:hypothetical protein [Sulfobacillus thermosulfidooxidans]